MQATVDDMRGFIQDAADANVQRDIHLQQTLQRLTDQAARQDDMNEMLPVLNEMCAEYGQRQNSRVTATIY